MKEKAKTGLMEEIEIPKSVKGELKEGILKIEGKQGVVSKNFYNPQIKMKFEENKIRLETKRATKKDKKLVGSLKSHIKNMIKGVDVGYTYRLKICSSHFPINVLVADNSLVVKNFIGEKIPRKLRLKEGVKVKIEGDIIIVESPNKELAGQTAADIEQLTKIKNKDQRVFQDGCYITEKAR